MSTVTDHDGGVTSYTYDEVGSLETVAYPSGTVAEYEYDSRNRLLYLENRKSTGEIISSYRYTLCPTGNRLRVVENTVRIVSYEYDSLYRLTRETFTYAAGNVESIAYSYDSFGNRLTKTDSNGTTTYEYDQNDRLLAETSSNGIATTYTYNDNGSTVSKTQEIGTTEYGYDNGKRLVSVRTPAGLTAVFHYDPDGIRTKSETKSETINFVVDKSRGYAQVLEERDQTGSLKTAYFYGIDLISQKNLEVSRSFYHYDGLGSTRALTDAAETVTDTSDYEAFGNLINQTGTTANDYLFTCEQYDPNAGFYYLI
jgi:YD repeat-containing protein